MDRMKTKRRGTRRALLAIGTTLCAIMIKAQVMGKDNTNAMLNDTAVSQRMCSRQTSGAAVISEKAYPTSGEFEFKIKPSLSNGVVTVLGLADDSTNPSNPYVQLMFDSQQYTNTSFAVVFGGPEINDTYNYMVNVSEAFMNERLL